jgi:hypothetical protein
MMRNTWLTRSGLLVLAMVLCSGCTSQQQVFDGYQPIEVWTAMRAVAESPTYSDWHVTMNEVWVDEDAARIEVYRETRRLLYRAGAKPSNQRRTWRFQLALISDAPPTVRFVSRGAGIPAHAQAEVDRFFIDLRQMLRQDFGEPAPSEASPTSAESHNDQPQPEAVSSDAESDSAVPIDVDDLD